MYVVDPGDAHPVLNHLKNNGLSLSGILITHHHWDHTNGITALLNAHPVPVYGAVNSACEAVTHRLEDTMTLELADGLRFKTLSIPGHTLDHMAYWGEGCVFTGDTLFAGGCGKIFEGTPNQMLSSLKRLMALPKSTQIYCGHEYTRSNLNFATHIEPNNDKLRARIEQVEEKLAVSGVSLPAYLEDELNTNPFLRCSYPEVIASVSAYAQQPLQNEVDVFAHLREWKNNAN